MPRRSQLNPRTALKLKYTDFARPGTSLAHPPPPPKSGRRSPYPSPWLEVSLAASPNAVKQGLGVLLRRYLEQIVPASNIARQAQLLDPLPAAAAVETIRVVIPGIVCDPDILRCLALRPDIVSFILNHQDEWIIARISVASLVEGRFADLQILHHD